MRGDEALAIQLINEGADVDEVSLKYSTMEPNQAGKTALESAAARGNAGMVELLVDAGAKINFPGHYPLLLAAQLGHADVVGLLLDAEADPNVRDDNGNSALDFAFRNGDDEMVELLAEAGALNRFSRRNMPQVF